MRAVSKGPVNGSRSGSHPSRTLDRGSPDPARNVRLGWKADIPPRLCSAVITGRNRGPVSRGEHSFQGRTPFPLQLRLGPPLCCKHGGGKAVGGERLSAGKKIVCKGITETPFSAEVAKKQLEVVGQILRPLVPKALLFSADPVSISHCTRMLHPPNVRNGSKPVVRRPAERMTAFGRLRPNSKRPGWAQCCHNGATRPTRG